MYAKGYTYTMYAELINAMVDNYGHLKLQLFQCGNYSGDDFGA